jgi:S-methylmethionine-dependent homocysteine/selenocysteine methylase
MQELLDRNEVVLMEAAIVERLRRAGRVTLDPRLVHALLVRERDGREALAQLYGEYIDTVQGSGAPLLLCTPTWRANRERIEQAGVDADLNGEAVRFLQELRSTREAFAARIIIGGLIGCRNDCYLPREGLAVDAARDFSTWQVGRLAAAGADFLMASTLPAVDEARGIARAMAATSTPYLISFVIDRQGRVLDGTRLVDAIDAVDAAASPAPAGYMVNCAHPSFLRASRQPAGLFRRLVGFQANASSLDHRDLDGADELEFDDVDEWGRQMVGLNREFGVRILGGCCGTGTEHLRSLVRGLAASTRMAP